MFKKTMIVAGICAMALTGISADASAGPKKKFVKHLVKHHLLHHHHVRRGPIVVIGGGTYYYGGTCQRYKRKFLRTGNEFWAKKWRACRLAY